MKENWYHADLSQQVEHMTLTTFSNDDEFSSNIYSFFYYTNLILLIQSPVDNFRKKQTNMGEEEKKHSQVLFQVDV